MVMRSTCQFLKLAKFALCLTFLWAGLALAQDDPDRSLKLPPHEVKRLQAVLATPVDRNALLTTQKELFQQKDMAAWMLGDVELRLSILREWVKIDPTIGWRLRNVLSMTPQRAEAFEIGQALIKDGILKRPTDLVRLRTELAMDYLQDGQVQKAQTLLDEAENTIRKDFKQLDGTSSGPYWRLRAEMEFHHVRAIFLSRKGKLAESIESAKLAVAKGKESFANDAPVGPTQKVHGRHWYIKVLAALASQQSAAGLFTDADVALRQAYQFAKAHGFSDEQLFGTYNAYADLRNASGQFNEAGAYADKAERIVLNQGFKKGTMPWIGTQNRKNIALVGADKWSDALANFDRVDEEKARIGNQSTAGVRPDLRAFVYLKTGRAEQALSLLRGNLRWHASNFGEKHDYTALVRGTYAAALWKTGDKAQARTQFDQAVKVMTAPQGLSGDMAEDAYRLKVKKFIFQSYVEMLAETASQDAQDAALIFQLADYLNASAVQQALADAAVRSGVNVPGLADIIRKEQDAKNEMVSLIQYMTGQGAEEDKRRNPQVMEQMRARMREIEESRKVYKAQIQKGFPEYFQLIQPKAPAHTDIALGLRPDELFVAALPMENQTYVWAIDASGSVQFHRSEQGEKQNHEMVDRIRKTLDVAGMGARAPAFNHADAHRLYKGLLGPIESSLVGKSHLIMATSGALAKMPWGVLVRQPVASANPRDAAFLIKDMAISQVPTASGWLALKQFGKVPSSAQPLMAWGDPVFDIKSAQQIASAGSASHVRSVIPTRAVQASGLEQAIEDSYLNYSKMPPLPETRDEVQELAKILGANPRTDVVLGAEATRASVLKSSASGQLGKKQVVVFATHGLLAGDLPNLNQPALAMAASANPAESPLLTLEDVLSLKLNADWVVLSACNTAGADGRAEEAMSGLARGFFFAGSRSLLVTHWSVESESAMQLTTHTFAAYKNNPNMRRAEALRQAMLQTMKSPQFAHPAYWAPYALVGEGGR
jgi:CHAT domain-containing protein/uncharacterized protein YdaT